MVRKFCLALVSLLALSLASVRCEEPPVADLVRQECSLCRGVGRVSGTTDSCGSCRGAGWHLCEVVHVMPARQVLTKSDCQCGSGCGCQGQCECFHFTQGPAVIDSTEPAYKDVLALTWRRIDANEYALMDGRKQVGGYRATDKVFRPYNGTTWSAPVAPPIAVPQPAVYRQPTYQSLQQPMYFGTSSCVSGH